MQDPAGYASGLGRGTTYWTWFVPGDRRLTQKVTAMAFPQPRFGGISFGLTRALAQLYGGHLTVLQRSAMPVCGYDGVYVRMHAADANGPASIEAVLTVADKRVYFASYSHLLAQPERAEAEHAIRTLCPPHRG